MSLNGIVWSNMAVSKRFAIFSFILMGLLFITGCVAIPTVPHNFGVVPDKEAFESFRPGVTVRADVLLLLGEPKHRLSDDRFLMYQWKVAYGYIVIYGGWGLIAVPHYMCLEFGADSRLIRREYLTGSFLAKPDEAIKRCVEQAGELDESEKK